MSRKNTRQDTLSRFLQPVVLWPLVIFALTFFVFFPVLSHGFFNMDDLPLITRNRLLLNTSLSDLERIFSYNLWSPYYKPITYLSWMTDRDLSGGINASTIHLTNVLLHCINAILVFFLLARLCRVIWNMGHSSYAIAGITALLWAVHPFRVESVAWAVERKDVLFSFFYLLACHAWISHNLKQKEWKWALLAALFFLLSCLSKSMAISFPATAFLLDLFLKRSFRVSLADKIPLLAVFLFMLILYGFFSEDAVSVNIDPMRTASAVPGVVSEVPPLLQHLSIASYRFFLLLLHTIVPVKIAIVYPREAFLDAIGGMIFLMPVLLIAIVAFSVTGRRRWTFVTFGILWFIITLSPVLAGEGIGTNFISDRYTYLPSIGVLLVIIIGLHDFSKRILSSGKNPSQKTVVKGSDPFPRSVLLFFIVLIAGAVFVARKQVWVWRSNLSLWQQAIQHYPSNWYALYNRAKLTSGTSPDAALQDLNKAIAEMPAHAELYFARGTLLLQQNNYVEAISDFDKTLGYQANHLEARINRGNAFLALKQYEKALADYDVALQMHPKSFKAFNNRGLANMDMGRLQLAAKDFDAAILINNNYGEPYLNRANLKLRPEVADYAGAEKDLTFYLSLFPASHNALFRRGYSKLRQGRAAEALKDIDEAIRLHGSEGYYHVARAQALEMLGQTAQSQAAMEKARSLGAN